MIYPLWLYSNSGGLDVLDTNTLPQEAYIRAKMEAESHMHLTTSEGCRSDPQSLDAWHTILGDASMPDGDHASLDW